MAAKPLESLSPSFDEEQHGTYLRRLEEAVADPRNRNIALTGRYGAGKSSVLDQFQADHAESTLRLAISSLTPGKKDDGQEADEGDDTGEDAGNGGEGESTTNQIQKEIVKQLLYGASEKVGRNSRFRRIAVLGRWRAFAQSLGFVVCVGGLLYLLGWLPDTKWTGNSYDTWQRVLAWAIVAALATVLVTVVRVLTAGRFQVAEFSAGGAALTLDKSPDSYFDKFLDEIVYYFGRESKDVVIFEDLDRFEDPGIFEALRELNLLLNETPERRRRRYGNRFGHGLRLVRRWKLVNGVATKLPRLSAGLARRVPDRLSAWLFGTGHPLRFVYALRDSVFEKLDAETAAAGAQPGQRVDAAAAETMRANRTKFFDIVISIVPFISHRNARDLLVKMLDKRGITDIKPRLVNTIAQHCTDMRLMRNMCNEYLVFAERLLEPKPPCKPAPGVNASRLFALVAYKNFHLGDFENITRRASALDRLYELHQKLVRDNIEARDAQKRHLLAEPDRDKTQAATAAMLGERLTTHAELVRRISPYTGSQAGFRVGSQRFEPSALTSYEFWAAVAQNEGFDLMASGSTTIIKEFNKADLAVFFPEALDADRWGEYDDDAAQNALAGIAADIKDLRRADFADLVRMPRFTLRPHPAGAAGTEDAEEKRKAFAELLEETLQSELACDLVRREYIDRNFSLYAAQFYGNFTGVDVATFMVQHVQSNIPAIDYDLSRDGAVENLLAEARDAGEALTETVAAFNIDIVNYLLADAHPDAGTVVDNLIAGWGSKDVSDFLAAYFTNEHAEREKLAARLVERKCRDVFTYLATGEGVPADARAALFSAAASAYHFKGGYDLNDEVRTFITVRYGDMPAFTVDHSGSQIPKRLAALLKDAHVVIPDLRPLGALLNRLVVSANRYDLTADNLRSALGIAGGGPGHPRSVPLDVVHDNDTVYAYCLEQLPTYLRAIERDHEVTQYAVTTPETLVAVLDDLIDSRTSALDDDVVDDLLAHTAPGACLPDLRAAQEAIWPALADAGLFRASLANMDAYRTEIGTIDVHLASLLKEAGTVYATDPGDYEDQDGDPCNREDAALALLGTAHLSPEVRVNLAASVGAATPLPVESIPADSNDLFAFLLRRQMVDDTVATFVHLRDGGWAALKPAILASTGIGTFLEHSVVDGMVADILEDPETAAKVGRKVVDHVEDYVPADDWGELKAVARYAGGHGIPLAPDTVVRIAVVGGEHGDVPRDLLLDLLSATVPAAAASHIVAVFDHLGPDYDKVRQTGETLEFDRADPHDQFLKVLKAANLVTGTRGTKKHFRVIVT